MANIAPLVPHDLDLRQFPDMPLGVARLRDSDTAHSSDPEAFRAAVLLWCVAWHQVPASSLPSSDNLLARYAGFGRDLKAWRRVREQAMHGFVLCTDGRFYHPVISEKALEADHRRRAFRERTAKATEAKRQRHGQRNDHRDDGRNDFEVKGSEGKEGVAEGRAREASTISPEAFAIADSVMEVFKIDQAFVPPGWCGLPMRAHAWTEHGWKRDIILIACRKIAAKGFTPDGFMYLEKPIARAHAEAEKPMPKVEVRAPDTVVAQGKSHVAENRSLVAAARRASDSAGRALGLGDQSSEPVLRIVSEG